MRPAWRIVAVWGVAASLFAGAGEVQALRERYSFGVNETQSLPNWAFVVDHRKRQPRLGELVVFKAPHNRYYPDAGVWVKHVWGLPGESVTRVGRDFYVSGRFVGHAKERSHLGEAVAAGPVGVIPSGHYYIGTAHKDGLDSRYALIGWLSNAQILGVAEPVL